MYRKKIIFLILVFISTFLISCNGKTDNTIVYNLVDRPTTIDPHQFSEMISVQVLSTINEGLLRLNSKGEYELGLASSFKEKDNVLEFKLKKGLKWSDGTDLTEDDIVFGIRRALNKKTAARYAELLFPIKNAKKYNKGEVSESELGVKNVNGNIVITLEKPTPYFKYILTMPISFPVKNGIDSEISDFKKTVYSGAFVIDEMNDAKIVLKKNKYYWDKNNVSIDKIKYIMVNKFDVIENLIKNNEIDITRVEPFDLETKIQNKELIRFQNGRVWYIDFNLKNELLKNKEVRQAINEAIDRNKYVLDIKLDGSKVAKSVISPVFAKYREKYDDKDYFIDNKENNILSGKTIRLLASNSTPEIKEASFIQEELRKKLNLDVQITIVTFKERLALTRQGEFDMVLNTYSPKFDDPISILDRWNKPQKDTYDVWRKKEYEDLLEKISKETNNTKRYELMNEAEKILIDDIVIAPLYFSTENWYVRKNLKNIVVHPISTRMDVSKIEKEN